MKKRIAMLVMGVLLLGGCGAKEPAQMPIDQNVAPTVEATPTPTPEPTATPTPTSVETSDVPAERRESAVEMTGGNVQTSVEESEDAVESLEAGFGYEDLLVGTQIGMSGSNCYVMVDGEGLLYNFDGYYLPVISKKNDFIVGANAVSEHASVSFLGYCGETKNNDRGGIKKFATEEIGDMKVDFFWDESAHLLEGYCEALDCGVYMVCGNPGDLSGDALRDWLKEDAMSRLSYFNANEGAE